MMHIERKKVTMDALKVLMIATTLVMVIMCLIFLVYSSVVAVESRNKLLDCTTPGRECYDSGQQSTGKLVKNLIDQNHSGDVGTRQVVLWAIVCQDEPAIMKIQSKADRFTAVEECVNDKLEDR
jgi:hypothetical protein